MFSYNVCVHAHELREKIKWNLLQPEKCNKRIPELSPVRNRACTVKIKFPAFHASFCQIYFSKGARNLLENFLPKNLGSRIGPETGRKHNDDDDDDDRGLRVVR